jgi:hypothetical protein
MLQTLKLNKEKQKKSSFYEEKRLVGLTPDQRGNLADVKVHPYIYASFMIFF